MIILSIDPGLKGYLASHKIIEGKVIEVHTHKLYPNIGDLISPFIPTGTTVIIEEQWPRRGQSAKSTATTMYNYGYLMGLLEAYGFDVIEITPQHWHKVIFPEGTDKKPKEKSIEKATELYGKEIVENNHNISDALLIGRAYMIENKII